MSSESSDYRATDCLSDIVDNVGRIEGYIAGMDRDAFGCDGLKRDAVERCLERVCEAAFRLGERAAALMPEQSWSDIPGMGNRLRHAYHQISLDIVWEMVCRDLPRLKAAARQALARLDGDLDVG